MGHDGLAREAALPPAAQDAAPSFRAPRDLAVWTLSVDGEEFALLEWSDPGLRDGRPLLARLTPAESAVVTITAEGRSNAEVARLRGCATRTVVNQLASAFRKLGIGSRLELYAMLARAGFPGADAKCDPTT